MGGGPRRPQRRPGAAARAMGGHRCRRQRPGAAAEACATAGIAAHSAARTGRTALPAGRWRAAARAARPAARGADKLRIGLRPAPLRRHRQRDSGRRYRRLPQDAPSATATAPVADGRRRQAGTGFRCGRRGGVKRVPGAGDPRAGVRRSRRRRAGATRVEGAEAQVTAAGMSAAAAAAAPGPPRSSQRRSHCAMSRDGSGRE